MFSGTAQSALVIHWMLDESSGTTANDSVGTAQNGTLFNPAGGNPNWVPGLFGNAYGFTGSANEVIAVTGLTNNAGPFVTWSAWINKSSAATGMIAGNISGTTTIFNEYAGIYATTNARILKRNNAATVTNPIGTSTINNGEWRHIVGTIDWIDANSNGLVDTSEQTRRLYVDGILEGTYPETQPRLNLSRFSVGANARGNFISNPNDIIDEFNGQIDDVGYWNNAIDGVDIALIHGLGRFSGVTLSDAAIAAVRAAWAAGAGNSATAGAHTWYHTSGLTGVTGSIGGSVLSGDAYIVLDETLGTGVTILIPEPASLALLALTASTLLLRRR